MCECEKMLPHHRLIQTDGARLPNKSVHLGEGKSDLKPQLPCGQIQTQKKVIEVNPERKPGMETRNWQLFSNSYRQAVTKCIILDLVRSTEKVVVSSGQRIALI